MANILLFDIAHRGTGAWSPNAWKTRLILNYKQIPYTTEWIEHANLEPRFKALGIPPNDPGPHSPYTVPAIKRPDGQYTMESLKIAQYLESTYPEPSLHLDTNLHDLATQAEKKVGFALIPVFMPRIPRSVLAETSVDWFRAARAKRFGMPLDDLERTKGGDEAWSAAEPGIQDFSRLLSEHKRDQGPFILGSQVCYGDFIVVALLEAFKRIGQDLFDRFVGYDGKLLELYEACQQWTQKDD